MEAVRRESAVEDTASSAPPVGVATPDAGASCRHLQGQVMVPLRTVSLAGEDTFVRDYMLFKKSAAPSRVMFFHGGAWRDFSAAVLLILRKVFLEGKVVADVSIGGSVCLFDFVRMVKVDVATGVRNSIAWIDVNGVCFFPRTFVDRGAVRPKSEMGVRVGQNGSDAVPSPPGEAVETKSVPAEPRQEHSDESQVIPADGGLERQKWAGVQVLDEGNKFYKIVESIFLPGMRRFAPGTKITSIRKCSYEGVSGRGRWRAFHAQAEMTKATRGDANVKYGWYGTSASGVASIINHGFGQPNNGLLGPQAQAVGVYLSAQNYPHASTLLSEADDGGEKHVILCRIIMGKVEKVDIGLPQFHPSSDEYDCGLDDLEKPRWCIVWNTRMNTHILPEYIVSFKTLPSGPLADVDEKVPPGRLTITFPKLFAEITNFLPSSKMQALEILHERFKAGKIDKHVFLKNVRTIAGDKLLATTVKRFSKCL